LSVSDAYLPKIQHYRDAVPTLPESKVQRWRDGVAGGKLARGPVGRRDELAGRLTS
jgi:hypothetical protein